MLLRGALDSGPVSFDFADSRLPWAGAKLFLALGTD